MKLQLIGRVFGSLLVVAQLPNDKAQKSVWSCRCLCGQLASARGSDLKRGKVVSCGCERVDRAIAIGHANREHGARANGGRGPTYVVWCGMRQRCSNPLSKDFKRYGRRGIRVCDRWDSFENFLADMGEKPHGKSIDRRGYEPGNCVWATAKEQANNRRTARGEHHGRARLTESAVVEIRSSTLSLSALARKFGVGKTTVGEVRRGEKWKHVTSNEGKK